MVVQIWWHPRSSVSDCQNRDSSCCPRSVVTIDATPNLATQPLTKVCSVNHKECLWPDSRAGENVGVSTGGWQWSYYVNVDVMETCVRVGESAEMCDHVALNFSPLTLKTTASPLTHVGIHTRPDETVGNEVLGCLYAGMGK